MQSPEAQKKFAEGPVGLIVLRPNGVPNMGRFLGLWFLLTLFVAAIVACLAATTLPVGASAHAVFHLAALVTFAAYACGSLSDGIWMGRPRRAVLFDLLDALIYAAISGAVFAWLWPR